MFWQKSIKQIQLDEIWNHIVIMKQDINDLISKSGQLQTDLVLLRNTLNQKLSGKGRKPKQEEGLKDSVLLPVDYGNVNPWNKDY